MVSTYVVYYKIDGEGFTDYVQALNAQQAADYAREFWCAEVVIEVAKVIKNWK